MKIFKFINSIYFFDTKTYVIAQYHFPKNLIGFHYSFFKTDIENFNKQLSQIQKDERTKTLTGTEALEFEKKINDIQESARSYSNIKKTNDEFENLYKQFNLKLR